MTNICLIGSFKKKRIALLSIFLLIPPCILLELRNFYYLTPCLIISIFSILWNFPIIATILHTKPLYLSDLEGDRLDKIVTDKKHREIFIEIKKRYMFIFIMTLSIATSFVAGALLDIWIYKTMNKTNIPEIIGITGGILSIYAKFQSYFGKFLLYILIKFKDKKEAQLCFKFNVKNVSNEKIIELNEINNKNNQNNKDELTIKNLDSNYSLENVKVNYSFDNDDETKENK